MPNITKANDAGKKKSEKNVFSTRNQVLLYKHPETNEVGQCCIKNSKGTVYFCGYNKIKTGSSGITKLPAQTNHLYEKQLLVRSNVE
ncbi:hypothetical protein C7N43_32405 [Sphingobacteriales bacterium UPWRP_1]|nr:hypothetical protein BVG80_06280 [Sphingobacteriales bacterium TSM_CSM]PSJ72808.1 hypothetical protein C7N43_32405 [Sphingobacteriales bacterium UPWRP_1]